MAGVMRRIGWVLAVAGLVGCFTPSIPIPPPDPAMMTFGVTMNGSGVSVATFSYPADNNYVGGVVYVFDENGGDGVIENANADGSFSSTEAFPAKLGDQVIVTVDVKNQSEATCVVLQNGPQSAADECE
jgi:hypothetical protein